MNFNFIIKEKIFVKGMSLMNVKKIPEIEYVFKGGISPYAFRVQSSTIDWAKKLNVLNETKMIEKYKNQNIGYLASRAQPYDSFSDINLTSDYLLILCMLDDYSEKVQDPHEFKYYSDNIISILKGNDNLTEKDAFLIGWENWWKRVKVGTPLEWQNRITKSITNCFEAIMWEIRNRINNHIPKVEDYVINRQHSGSVFVCFDLVERGGNRYLPTDVRNDLFIDLVNSASKIANWTNDILSFKKEVEEGEVHNLVICVQKQNQTSMQDSLERVKQMFNNELSKYNELKQQLLIENKSYNKELKKYIFGLESAVHGQYEWGLRTKRF